MPYLANSGIGNPFLKESVKNKTDTEIALHQKRYHLYNMLFNETYKKRLIEYNRKYYQLHREKILRNLRKDTNHDLLVIQKGYCNEDCENCIYSDCIIPLVNSREEYNRLYYFKFHDKLSKQKQEYRNTHRNYLSNSEKLRNYQKKGYAMITCTLTETTNPDLKELLNTSGSLSIIKVNNNDYISFISEDRNNSFRAKIISRLNDLSIIGCTQAWYDDDKGYSYTFSNPENANPLWEMEKGDNFQYAE